MMEIPGLWRQQNEDNRGKNWEDRNFNDKVSICFLTYFSGGWTSIWWKHELSWYGKVVKYMPRYLYNLHIFHQTARDGASDFTSWPSLKKYLLHYQSWLLSLLSIINDKTFRETYVMIQFLTSTPEVAPAPWVDLRPCGQEATDDPW